MGHSILQLSQKQNSFHLNLTTYQQTHRYHSVQRFTTARVVYLIKYRIHFQNKTLGMTMTTFQNTVISRVSIKKTEGMIMAMMLPVTMQPKMMSMPSMMPTIMQRETIPCTMMMRMRMEMTVMPSM